MGKAKRTLSVIMAALMLVFTCMTYVPANAAVAGAPEVAFVGIGHSPLVVGDTETFSLTTKNADSVQYNVVLKDAKGTVVEDLTKGYSPATAGNAPYVIKSNYVFALGKYTLAVTAKRADGVTTTYDAALNCVTRDNANRVYANGDVDGVKDNDTFVKNTPITIAGIKDLGGIAGPYKYRLHVFNATTNTWSVNVQSTYSDNIVWTPSEAGTYVLDIHISTPNSTTWKTYTENPLGPVYGTYEAWKLVTVKVVDSKYSLVLSNNVNGKLTADGQDHAVVTAKFWNNLTNAVENVDGLVAFTTTYGNLANTRVALQDGVANVTLNSEFSAKAVTAKVDAQLIEAAADYKDYINTSAQSMYVAMAPASGTTSDVPQLIGAESNEAGSVTLFFDKDVTPSTFVADTDKNGKLDVVADDTDPHYGDAILKSNVAVTIGQPIGGNREIRGFKPVAGNPKAIEVILARDSFLIDNEEVNCVVAFNSSGVKASTAQFILTDARQPELTKAVANGLKQVVLTFSEPVADFTGLEIDGGLVDWYARSFGNFNQVTGVDSRNIVTVNLGTANADDTVTPVYLTGGTHSVQVGAVQDFAALSDIKNFSSTQTLDFYVPVDNTLPTATITQESPEQFRVKFAKPVENFTIADLRLQKYNVDEETWEDTDTVLGQIIPGTDYVMTDVNGDGTEFVVEFTRNWTEILQTATTKESYFTDSYRFVIPKHVKTAGLENSGVMNPANGKWNTADIVMALPGLKTPDVTSPVIKSIVEDADIDNAYDVTMDEPVKLPGLDIYTDADKNVTNLDTPSQLQIAGLPAILVDFIGTNASGKQITVDGALLGYNDGDSSDKSFVVTTLAKDPVTNADIDNDPATAGVQNTLQSLVDAGFSKNWTVVVKNVTDDVGNAAPTLAKSFVVNPTAAAATIFEVAEDANGFHYVDGFMGVDNDLYDTITVRFTSPFKYTGTTENALNVANYLLDGVVLPKDSRIVVDKSFGNSTVGYSQITIIVPRGTLLPGAHTLSVSKYMKSLTGVSFTGETEFVFYTGLN